MPPRGRPPHPSRTRPHHARTATPSAPSAAPEPTEQRKLFRVAGLAAVSALFAHEPERVERLFFDERLKPAVGAFCKAMAAARKPYRMVEGEELAKVAGTVLHGGVVALMAPRSVPLFDPEVARRAGEPLLILDGVGNPHNLGAILRTAAFFGLPRVLVSDHPGQALPSEAAYRVAEGGFEWVTLERAPALPALLKRLRTSHRVFGTALDQSRPTVDAGALTGWRGNRNTKPPAVILGNEEDGIPPATLAACEAVLTIPGSGRVQSLNVAATAAILIHALAAG
ncbi:TrmH family RNA methyltransferase [Azospirillum lipoferum]|uniref:23S rRNA (Guanosine-2'-O-)-methyltransferase (RlmB-like) n=1 Tax=Azospirillum lipoferum (strain 4B) TaxID=862719 RepID=G7Z2G3_AZOL4|nr:RNA methyltransferase [Azospirillum lipoferum]CBS85575.1 putative 23S rRNA (guanosine-2'-O-)-methyltransferase (RlmB-like) [Azospirillum lipoferum 4B]